MEYDQIKICYKKGEIIGLLLMLLMGFMMGLGFVWSLIITWLNGEVPMFIAGIALGIPFFGFCLIDGGVEIIRNL